MSQDRYTDAVREAMDRLPVSRRELARRAGLSHTTLNDIARGKQPASAAVVKAVADAVGDLSSDMAVARDTLKGAVQAARRELKRQRRKEADDG